MSSDDGPRPIGVEYEPDVRGLAVALAAAVGVAVVRGGRALVRRLRAWARVEFVTTRGLTLALVVGAVVLGFGAARWGVGASPDEVRAAAEATAVHMTRLTVGNAGVVTTTLPGGGEWGSVPEPEAEPAATENPADAYAPRPSGAGCRDVPGLSAPVLALCDTIDAAGTEMRLDPRVLAVLVEAECPYEDDAQCVSHAGAFGRAQLMPETAATLAVQTGLPCESSQYDHYTNLQCGARYLTDGMLRASALWRDGRELTAILVGAVTYNAGHGRAPEALACIEAGTPLSQCTSLPAETRRYVAKWRPLLEAAGYSDAQPVAVAR